VIWSVATHLP